MKTPRSLGMKAAALAALFYSPVNAAPPAAIQGAKLAPAKPSPATLTIPVPPALPTLPATLNFHDEVEGRHLLYDTRTIYRHANGVSFTAHWTGGQGGAGETVAQGKVGDEVLAAVVSERKVAIVVDTLAPNGDREIRRATSDGTEVATSHFIQTGNTPAATADSARRTYARLTLDESSDLARALAQIQLDPQARAAAFAIDPRAYVAGADATLWVSGYASLPDGARVAIVNQVESANPDNRQENRHRICRYAIEPETHRLRRFEIWDVNSDQPRRARQTRRRTAGGGVTTVDTPGYASTINYRREDYSKVSLSAQRGPWSLSIPANYEEKALPAVDLPAAKPLLSPANYNPKALALLDRWRGARERYLSLNTEIDVADRDVPRTAESRIMRNQQNTALRYRLVYRRPGKANVGITTITGGGFRRGAAINGTLIADNEQATWTTTDGDSRTQPMRNPAALLDAMNRLGIRDPFNAMGAILSAPPEPETFEKIAYDGQVMLDARTPAESITLQRTIDRRNGQSQTDYTMQVLFGSDGLPRWVRTRVVTNLNGRLERDQPAIETIDTQFVNLVSDSEPSPIAFVRPHHG